jgi:transposase
MDIHKNARLTPLGRERLVRLVASGHTQKAAGEAVGVCPRTVRKWVERYRENGPDGARANQLAREVPPHPGRTSNKPTC